jgi:hypothetical protein
METVAEGLEVLRDTVRAALGRVRVDLGQTPTDEEPDRRDEGKYPHLLAQF